MFNNNLLWNKSPYLLLIPFLILYHGIKTGKNFYQTSGFFILYVLIYFHRNPNRKFNYSKNIIVSPAEGKIQKIFELNDFKIISIFLNIFDVHVQYSPYYGKITNILYKKGTFHPAYMFKKSSLNERQTIKINTKYGNIYVTQIAGLVAKNILKFVNKNDIISRGERLGMIRFGSRVDIAIPKNNTSILVKEKQRTIAGKTQLAKWI